MRLLLIALLAACTAQPPAATHAGPPRAAALDVLAEEGFTEVTHRDGGMSAWRAAGLPVE